MCPVSLSLLAVAAVGTGVSTYGAIQGQNAQKDAARAQQHMNDLKAARERTQQVREARAKSADISQRGADQGSTGSSSVMSGAAGVNQEAYGNIQYVGYEQQTGEALTKAKQRELNAEGLSTIGKGITDIAGSALANQDAFSSP